MIDLPRKCALPAAKRSRSAPDGVALVLVLWVIAALSLIVVTMSGVARTEARAQIQFGERTQALALTDGALRVAGAALLASAERPLKPSVIETVVDGRVVKVEIVSAVGLINVNHAPEPLLADLFALAAGLDRSQAESLAHNVVQWRGGAAADPGSPDPAEQYRQQGLTHSPRGSFFARVEDLRQVVGLSPEVYDTISRLVTVARVGSGGVNPLAAPPEVLAVMANNQSALVNWLVSRREDAAQSVADLDLSQFAHVVQGGSSAYRLAATYVDERDRTWQRVAWLDLPPGQLLGPVRRWSHVQPIIVVPSSR